VVAVKTKVVIGSDRDVHEGQKVLLTEQKEWVELHRARERGEDMTEYRELMQKGFDYNVYHVAVAIFATVGVVIFCKKVCRGRWKWTQLPALIVWFVILGFYLKSAIVIPGEWIPEKLIDLNGWRANMERFPF